MSVLAEIELKARDCQMCPLSSTRTQVVFGIGRHDAELMFVGEAPGRQEDLKGEPFVGRSGALLDRLLFEELGLKRSNCYIANVVKCRPPENRNPSPLEISACSHYLEAQIELIRPTVIVTLGNFATRALLQRPEGITQLRGHSYPFGTGWLVPTFHPAAALRGGGEVLAAMRADLVRASGHLRSASDTQNSQDSQNSQDMQSSLEKHDSQRGERCR